MRPIECCDKYSLYHRIRRCSCRYCDCDCDCHLLRLLLLRTCSSTAVQYQREEVASRGRAWLSSPASVSQDVATFLFYILCEVGADGGHRIAGYFSKEKARAVG
jgi:hypothetical protein